MNDAKFSLAESLAVTGNEALSEALVDLCRPPDDSRVNACDPRVQSGILAACRFLSFSPPSSQTSEKLLAIVVSALSMLASSAPELSPGSSLETVTAQDAAVESFSRNVVSGLVAVCRRSAQLCFVVVSNLSPFLRAVLDRAGSTDGRRGRAHIARGALAALASSELATVPGLRAEDVAALASPLESCVLKYSSDPLLPQALLVLARLAAVPACPDDRVESLFRAACSPDLVSEEFVASTTLAAACADHLPSLLPDLHAVLSRALESAELDDSATPEATVFLLKSITSIRARQGPGQVVSPAHIEDALRFALDASSALVNDDVRAEACRSLCALLRADSAARRDDDSPRPVVSKLLARVSSIHESAHRDLPAAPAPPPAATPAARPLGNELFALKTVSLELRESSKVIDQVVGGLVNSVAYPLCSVDRSIITTLIEIAAVGAPAVASDVALLIINVYKRIVKDAEAAKSSPDPFIDAISGRLTWLARELRGNPQARALVCERFLVLFQQLGQDVRHPAPEKQRVAEQPTVRAMASMLPFMGELLDGCDADAILRPDEHRQQLFRVAWLYCVFLDFATRGHMSADWQAPVTRLARSVPVLTLGKSHQLIKIELEVEAMLKISFADSSGRESVRKRLCRHLPACAPQTRQLTVPQCSFLLAIYYLEVLRVRSGEFRALFSYLGDATLADQRVSNIGYIAAVFRAVADEAFAELVNGLHIAKFDEASRSDKLAGICEFLLVHYASNVEAVRGAADVYISQFVGNFPQVLWHRRCLTVLLELLDIVARGRSIGPLDKTHREVPGTSYFVDLPEEAAATVRLHASVVGLCNNWLREAIRMAPSETFAVLHAYMKRFSESARQLAKSHYGVSLAAEVLSTSSGSQQQQQSPRDPTSASLFVTALASKARFGGEVGGMELLLEEHGSSEAATRLATVLLARLDGLCPAPGKVPDLGAYVGTMYQASAFLARHGHVLSCAAELVSRVVWLPVRIFTRDSLEVATSAWSWLLASLNPRLAETLMAQVWLAWCWTIDSRMGLFSDAPRPPSPLSIKRDPAAAASSLQDAAEATRKSDCGPHRVWLSFLAERLVVAENAENGHINILFKILYSACADPRKLSALSESFGTRFHMLLLALKLARVLRERRLHQLHIQSRRLKGGQQQQQQPTTNPQPSSTPTPPLSQQLQQQQEVSEGIFVERIHAAALTWFLSFPSWYEPPTRKELEEDMAAAAQFCETLLVGGIPGGGGDRQSKKSGGSLKRGSVRGGSVRSVSSVTSLVPAMMAAPQVADGALGEDAETHRRALLVVLLVGNELERIAVWNNPLNRLSLHVAGEHAKYRDLRLPWQEYTAEAWAFEPELAVMLWVRHSSSEELRRCVTHLVLHDPARVARSPHALRLLVTEQHVKKNIPQLKHLLYWAPTDPPAALAMLHRRFDSHPLVTQYALRVLRQFTPETVIFYLPQLVQSLRYDRTGLVEEWIVDAASRSELLAHQLIWNTQTYPKDPPREGYRVDPEFAVKADRVRQRIIANFTPEQRERFEAEFSFFDNFTAISARLLPVDADSRRQRLREELRKVAPRPGGTTYMPFAPDIVVRGVDAESPLVLRSAEKVPIMVHFHVNDRGSPDGAPTHMHSVIFKSGDDTRQDMLAVQVLGLLQRIYESAGLKLFLFPYKIIATKPDCGIIEVVPNSLSRDQIGQKTDGTMYDYFIGKYGACNTPGFQQARNNFIRSMAAYSVASYLLNVKDRHNGNILIDESGHLVHIDFGFLFDRSPGGDIGFEKSPFKITEEMIDIMGGSPNADQFVWFMEQGVRAFLASREYMPGIATLVELMIDTQLPCFKPAVTITNLEGRFFPSVSVCAAAKSMSSVMAYAFSSRGTFFTYFYDKFQEFDNGIAM